MLICNVAISANYMLYLLYISNVSYFPLSGAAYKLTKIP